MKPSLRIGLLSWLTVLTVLVGCTTPYQPSHDDSATSTSTDVVKRLPAAIDLTRPAPDVWERIRRGFAIPNLQDKLVDTWTQYYASHPQQIQLMSQRAGRYLYHVVQKLEDNSLPTELALLPFVESAYNPTALSRAQASGLWQFMPATGRQYNLHQDWWRDLRRDPIASTDAALEYLAYLYEFQGDWYLALASYNWGEGSVRRAIEKNAREGRATDYLSLRMPDETRNYVPKLQAIKNIVADPKRYGITLPHVANTPYFVTVHKTRPLDVTVAAQLAQMSEDEFKALNPAHKRPVIFSEEPVLLPADRAAVFEANLVMQEDRIGDWESYQTTQGDTYAAIAERHGISVEQLLRINGLSHPPGRTITQTLLVPAPGVRPASFDHPAWREAPSVRTHIVKKGDTLYALARRYKTSVKALQQLNRLRHTRLSLGQRLRVPGGARS